MNLKNPNNGADGKNAPMNPETEASVTESWRKKFQTNLLFK